MAKLTLLERGLLEAANGLDSLHPVPKRTQEDEDENLFGGDDGSSIDTSDSPGSGASTPKRNGPSAPVALKAGGRRKVQARKRQQK